MKTRIDPAYGWESQEYRGVEIHAIRDDTLAKRLAELMLSGASVVDLGEEISNGEGPFAGILSVGGQTLAYVDTIRSYPVFFVDQPEGRWVGNNAQHLVADAKLRAIDQDAFNEFLMAGYVTGADTMYAQLKQLVAGECFLATDEDDPIEPHRYYRYAPNPTATGSEDEMVATFRDVLDGVFRKFADTYRDAPIRIPLSGGLDSRLVLCKLKEFGCRDIETFSYGPPNNYDSRISKRVASTLGVPWRFIPYRRAGQRDLFESNLRRQYWDYAIQLSTSPSMREFEAITILQQEKSIPADAILINGQTGDFLSGGHIPEALWQPKTVGTCDLFDAIFAKHFALWKNLMTPDRLTTTELRIRESVGGIEENPSKERIIALYEQWECQERQLKFVVNGQRMYEFFGYPNWHLPLWDRALMDFWSTVPFAMKYKQKLYKRYLAEWDYRGLFSGPVPTVWRWPVHMMWVVAVARAAGFINVNLKQEIYRYMWIFGHYSNYYAMYPLMKVLRTRRKARSPISLYVDTWARENGLAEYLPQEIIETTGAADAD